MAATPSARRSNSAHVVDRPAWRWASASGWRSATASNRSAKFQPVIGYDATLVRARVRATARPLPGSVAGRWTSSCRPTTTRAAWRSATGWPSTPSPSGRELAEAGYVAPHWPAPVGPRRRPDPPADHRRRADQGRASAGRSTRSASAGPARRSSTPARGAEAPLPVADPRRRGVLVPAVLRAGQRQRPRQPRHPGRARRRRVRRQRAEDLDERRAVRPFGILIARTDPDAARSTRASRTSSARWTRRASRSARSPR